MQRPDKATIERNSRTLRDLVKRPENKVCADCKRNDPRWASWNLGVFLCIRCSGIHRGMGTHISKVKSVDLDVWTPEQMASIQKWGNHRANLYWEAHLKQGHVPPEHKMESFVRSKYESRRWAMEGAPPSDPSMLEGSGGSAPVEQAGPSQQQAPPPISTSVSSSTHAPSPSLSSRGQTTRQPQAHQLLSSAYTSRTVQQQKQQTQQSVVQQQSAAAQPAPQAPPASAAQDLFSLDFHTPSPSSTPAAISPSSSPDQQPKKDVKQNILALFSAPPSATAPSSANTFGSFNSPWGQPQQQPQPQQVQPQPTSMIGNTGAGAWGASSGWGASVQQPAAAPNVWGSSGGAVPQPATNTFFDTSDVWKSSGSTTAAGGVSQDLFGGFASNTAAAAAAPPKKDDAFGDIWGGFK